MDGFNRSIIASTADEEIFREGTEFPVKHEQSIKYKCLFYHTRTCPIREQMEITDEKLSEGQSITERIRERQTIQETNKDQDKMKTTRNTADWLVNSFCKICPHIGA